MTNDLKLDGGWIPANCYSRKVNRIDYGWPEPELQISDKLDPPPAQELLDTFTKAMSEITIILAKVSWVKFTTLDKLYDVDANYLFKTYKWHAKKNPGVPTLDKTMFNAYLSHTGNNIENKSGKDMWR